MQHIVCLCFFGVNMRLLVSNIQLLNCAALFYINANRKTNTFLWLKSACLRSIFINGKYISYNNNKDYNKN